MIKNQDDDYCGCGGILNPTNEEDSIFTHICEKCCMLYWTCDICGKINKTGIVNIKLWSKIFSIRK